MTLTLTQTKNNNHQCRPRIPNHNPNDYDSRKGRLFAALGLGLGILDTALYLNQLLREPGELLAGRSSLFCFAHRGRHLCVTESRKVLIQGKK